ncbi:MAG TPA: alpha/beta fold hydrolase [Burkholderiaceae bacterium]|nr:alpha/beta fold hydrolase [Burkholderiaceae bacterium]
MNTVSSPNPAAAFYASPAARALGAAVRAAHRVSADVGTALAMRLFFTPRARDRHARVAAVPAPWRPHRHRFERGELVSWQRTDTAGAARVLLTHGWAGDAQQMRMLGDAVAAAGLDPVLLDLPAHGASDGRRATLPQWVRALFTASATLGPWSGVVAHSLGALAAAHAAARGLPVQRLVLLAPSPPPALFLRWYASGLGLNDALAERMEDAIRHREGIGVEQFAPDWLGPRVSCPTLVLHDADDRTAPLPGGRALAKAIRLSHLQVTQGLGHRRILEDPTVADAVVRQMQGPFQA